MSFMDKLSSGIDTVAEKVEGNKYLRAIKDAFTAYMPFIIIGSFALLFNVLLTSPTTGLAQFAPFSFLTALAPAFPALTSAASLVVYNNDVLSDCDAKMLADQIGVPCDCPNCP